MKELKCSNCGSVATLLPSGTQAFCEACGSKFIINDLRNVNPNIADKANLVAALSYHATDEMLHARIVNFLTEQMQTHSVPCDILNEMQIISSKEKHAFSGFQFDCHYTATWAGEKESTRQVDDSHYDKEGNYHSRTKTLVTTIPVTGTVSGSPTLYGCAVKDADSTVHELFDEIQAKQMDDAEFAAFEGEDIIHHPFSLPISNVFNLRISERIADLACYEANQYGALNCVVGHPNINYDRSRTRVVVTAAKVNAEYNGNLFPFWISGDGVTIAADRRIPGNSEEEAKYAKAQKKRAECKRPRFVGIAVWTFISIGIALILIANPEGLGFDSVHLFLGLVGTIMFGWIDLFYKIFSSLIQGVLPDRIWEDFHPIAVLLFTLISPAFWITVLLFRNLFRKNKIAKLDKTLQRLDAPYQEQLNAFMSRGGTIRGGLSGKSQAKP